MAQWLLVGHVALSSYVASFKVDKVNAIDASCLKQFNSGQQVVVWYVLSKLNKMALNLSRKPFVHS